MNHRDLNKAAIRGEPSYVWREGQDRRLQMILDAAGERVTESILENGCGIGLYVEKLSSFGGNVIGLEYDFPRAVDARNRSDHILNAAGENLPFNDGEFDLILSHEVLEHVQDDKAAVTEMVRALRPGGRIVIFCPNRGYPFETHGIYWRGRYKFGNIPLVNWLPRRWRDFFVPHVKVYGRAELKSLTQGLPVSIQNQTIIFGAYDNLIARYKSFGKIIRRFLQFFENTPLRVFGLSHFLVLEKSL
jgi:SAM-dependent methyltransferase